MNELSECVTKSSELKKKERKKKEKRCICSIIMLYVYSKYGFRPSAEVRLCFLLTNALWVIQHCPDF